MLVEVLTGLIDFNSGFHTVLDRRRDLSFGWIVLEVQTYVFSFEDFAHFSPGGVGGGLQM